VTIDASSRTVLAPGEPFSQADRRLVDDLARQAGVAVHAVRLFADLQRSRERLVTPARRSGVGSGEICTMDLRRSLRP